MPAKELLGLLIGILQKLHHLMVDLCSGIIAAVQHSPAGKVLVFHGSEPHQAEFLGHAVLGDHGPGHLRRLLNIVGCSGCDGIEDKLFRRPAAKVTHQHGFQFLLGIQVFFFLRYLHHVAKRSHGPGNDGNLLHRLRVFLEGIHKCMAYFMVGNNAAFLCGKNTILLLLAYKHHLHCLQQILLGNSASSLLHGKNGAFIDHIGKIRAHGAGGCQGNGIEIYGIVQMYILCVHLQDLHSSLQVRPVHNDTPVKTPRTKKGRIQYLGTVGSRQDQKTTFGIEAIHLCKKLVQSLLSLVISAAIMGIPGLADGIDLIDKNDTGSILFCFFKKIPDTGSTHADEHFHKFRTGQGKEGHMRLSCHSLREQGLSCARRPHQKSSFGKLRSDRRIFPGIVQEIHHFLKRFLCLVLACHILEGDACLLLDISLGAAFSDAHDPSAVPVHPAKEKHHHTEQQNGGQKNADQHGDQLRHHIRRFRGENDPRPLQSFCEGSAVLHQVRVIRHILKGFALYLWRDADRFFLKNYFPDLVLFHHIDEFIVADLSGIVLQRICKQAQAHQRDEQAHQKSQNGLMVLTRPLAIGIAARTVSVMVVVQLITHFVPPLILPII